MQLCILLINVENAALSPTQPGVQPQATSKLIGENACV